MARPSGQDGKNPSSPIKIINGGWNNIEEIVIRGWRKGYPSYELEKIVAKPLSMVMRVVERVPKEFMSLIEEIYKEDENVESDGH